MFGGTGCEAIAKSIIPQCWSNSSVSNPKLCFNTQLIRLQQVWEALAKKYSFVTAINLLGTTQVAGGDKEATLGHPNMAKFGPAHYWPITLECIHPGTSGGANSGAMVIMKQVRRGSIYIHSMGITRFFCPPCFLPPTCSSTSSTGAAPWAARNACFASAALGLRFALCAGIVCGMMR
jgi:hypothetical protein